MSLEFDRSLSFSTKRRSAAAIPCLLAILTGIPLAGCGPTEPKEISAATSGYQPAKDKDTKSTLAGAKSTDKVSPNSPSGASDPSSLPPAPSLPEFQPGKMDPKIASKLYMTLKLGDLNGAKPLMEFLNTSSRAVMELIADGRKRALTNEVLLDRGMSLSRMKLEASERLEKLAANEDEKAASMLGKLEAYSQMASFGDVAATDSLRELATKEMENGDKRVAQQAKSIALSLVVNDFESGTAKSSELVSLAMNILSSGKDLTATNLNALTQSVESLSRRSEKEPELQAAALQLAKKIEEGFRENPEPQIALSAWEIHASRLKETNDVGLLMQSDSPEDQDPVKARVLIDALMAKIPSPWTAFFLVQIAIKVEYSGRPLVAKEMIEVAQTQIENLKDPDAKAELDRNCKQFLSRVAVLNKPLNLSELVDTAGKPLDLAQYKGKVVLVDFWATWCGPCLQEIPNIENAFLAHNKNGFEVISVNLDEDRPALDKFLASKKVLWNTYVSSKPDAIGFDTPLARDIGISAIPFIAIIGKDGNVAGIHIRGRKIEDKIVELLAKE